MSELMRLDPLFSPSMTVKQCLKRAAELKQTIEKGWEFLEFLKKLDPAMRLSYLNYLSLQAPLSVSNHLEETEVEPFSEIKDYTQTLSPKKRSKKGLSKAPHKKVRASL